MITYWQNGTMSDFERHLRPSDGFGIQELPDTPEKLIYPGDKIRYSIDYAVLTLFDRLVDFIFTDTNDYYAAAGDIPSFVARAGLDSESMLSSQEYKQILEYLENQDFYAHKNNSTSYQLAEQLYALKETGVHIYKHFYLHDLTYLVSAIQDLEAGLNHCFVSYFQLLSEVSVPEDLLHEDTTWTARGAHVERVVSIASSYFVKLHSILDILTKIQYELENIPKDYSKYVNCKSKKITYGDAAKLRINKSGTLFEKDDFIREIESIRNEIVHNGTWANNVCIYVTVEDNQIVERYLMYPDMVNGHYARCKNRHHFFSNGTRVNDRLVHIHFEFLKRLRMSLEIMANPHIESNILIQTILKQDEEEITRLADFFRQIDSGEQDC